MRYLIPSDDLENILARSLDNVRRLGLSDQEAEAHPGLHDGMGHHGFLRARHRVGVEELPAQENDRERDAAGNLRPQNDGNAPEDGPADVRMQRPAKDGGSRRGGR